MYNALIRRQGNQNSRMDSEEEAMRIRHWLSLAILTAMTFALMGCSNDGGDATTTDPVAEEAPAPVQETAPEPMAVTAQAVLQPTAETEGMSGTVTFTEAEGSVMIVAHIEGAPSGPHGFHIHEIGDCSSSDFKSAGGHFNPGAVDHAGPTDHVRHAGDLGNIEVGEDGTAHLEMTSDLITLGEGDNSIMGRGVILHKDADDLTSQPTGAAGARIGCGVIAAPEAAGDDTAGTEEQAAH